MFHEEYRTSRRRCGGNTLVPSGRRTDVRDKDERDRCLRSAVDEERLVDADVCRTGTALRTAKIGVSVSENATSEHGGVLPSVTIISSSQRRCPPSTSRPTVERKSRPIKSELIFAGRFVIETLAVSSTEPSDRPR